MRLTRLQLVHVMFAALVTAASSGFAVAHDQAKSAEPSTVAAESAQRTGTVERLIVNDRVAHATHRFDVLRFADGAAVMLEGGLPDFAQPGARVEVTGTVVGKTLRVSSARLLQKATASAPDNVEVEGTLAVAHADDFATGKSEFIYEIHEAGGSIRRLDMPSLPPLLQPGMRISVGAHTINGETLRPSRIDILDVPASAPKTGARSDYVQKAASTVLVILANFNNTATPSFTQASAQDVMANSSSSVANFFDEVSFGQQTLSVTVTGWVTMAMSSPSTCSWQTIGNAASTAATNNGYNPANYAFVVYLFPQVSACGWNGLAYINSPHKAYINGTNSFRTQVITHEMGHNFGLLHAGSLDCGAAVIGGGCSVSEYGDPFDTMGNQRSMHYNAQQKRKLSWIPSASVATHSAGTLTYSLTPIESAGGTTYAIKIPTANASRTYWIEYRQPIGFDSPLSAYPNNGAQIRVANPFETLCSGCDSYSNDTELLDMTPSTSTFTDAALVAGQSFTDATYGITVNVLSASASALTVQVSTGGSQTATTTTLATSVNPASYGSTVTFTATVSGNAPTGTVAFTDGGVAIGGCGAVALTGSGNSRSAACSTSALAAGTHAIAAAYSGDGANSGSSSSPLSQSISAASTTTSIASSANPSTFGASVTFTASVSGVAPTGTVDFADGGASIAGCGSVSLTGSGNIRTAQCSTSALSAGSHEIAASYGGNAGNSPSSSPTLSQVVTSSGGSASSANVALAANGGVASASSTYSAQFPVAAINDGDRSGAAWGNGGGWNDATFGAFPDWVQIDFNGGKTIDRVVVYTLRDNYGVPADPSDSETFSSWGIVDFSVQAWNGASWITIATVTGNNLVKRTVSFSPTATDRVRVVVANALFGHARVVEVEAWTASTGSSNVALTANGGIAWASSTYSGAFPVAAVNDGDRSGAAWGNGGGWNDANFGAFPDWVEIDFNGSKTIDRVVVYTLRDYFGAPVDPSDGETFSLWGIVDFSVQAWNGASWITIATVTANNLVKRTVTFSPTATDRVRVVVTNALFGHARVVELEVWGF